MNLRIKVSIKQKVAFGTRVCKQGRKDEDVASIVWKCLLESKNSDCKNITIWCDNCTGQNKNWTLYSSIVQSLSISQIPKETITLKYFEKEHTFMAVDSFHLQVEEGIRKSHHLHDFNDYVQAVNLCGDATETLHKDFYDFRNYKSNEKYLKIYLKSFNDSEFKSGQFFTKDIPRPLQ